MKWQWKYRGNEMVDLTELEHLLELNGQSFLIAGVVVLCFAFFTAVAPGKIDLPNSLWIIFLAMGLVSLLLSSYLAGKRKAKEKERLEK